MGKMSKLTFAKVILVPWYKNPVPDYFQAPQCYYPNTMTRFPQNFYEFYHVLLFLIYHSFSQKNTEA